jgi:hypothetical protein
VSLKPGKFHFSLAQTRSAPHRSQDIYVNTSVSKNWQGKAASMGGYNVDNSSYLNYGFLMGKSALPTHNLDLLDALRGVAAYAVVFWHWQHFFYDGTKPTDFLVSSQPLFEYFSIF